MGGGAAKNKQGFTIIEVVLVLAIAGLIFLMVFIALPALQRGQRDTERRQDLARAAAAIDACIGLNPGSTTCKSSVLSSTSASRIPDDEFKDPTTGQRYTLVSGGQIYGIYNNDTQDIGNVYMDSDGYCDGDRPVDAPINRSGSPKYVIAMKLESGGTVCISNATASDY